MGCYAILCVCVYVQGAGVDGADVCHRPLPRRWLLSHWFVPRDGYNTIYPPAPAPISYDNPCCSRLPDAFAAAAV